MHTLVMNGISREAQENIRAFLEQPALQGLIKANGGSCFQTKTVDFFGLEQLLDFFKASVQKDLLDKIKRLQEDYEAAHNEVVSKNAVIRQMKMEAEAKDVRLEKLSSDKLRSLTKQLNGIADELQGLVSTKV